MKNDVKALVSAALFLLLLFSVVSLDLRPVLQGGAPRVQQNFPAWGGAAQSPDNPSEVAGFIFGPYALPFEVLSVVLLVALVAALALAKPDRTEDDQP